MRMIHVITLLSFWLALASPASGATAAPTATPATTTDLIWVDHVDEQTIYFKAAEGQETPAPLKTALFELKFLSALHPDPKGLPLFMFAGRPCQDCIQDKALYLFRFGTPLPITSFVYPGRLFESKSRALVLESRAFIGKCLAHHGEAYVVFQRERVDKRRGMQSSVYIAEPKGDRLSEELVERRLPSVNYTLTRVRKKECAEVEGRHRVMVSKTLRLTHPSKEEDDDEDKPEKDPEKDKKE